MCGLGTVSAGSVISFYHIMPRSRREPVDLKLEITQLVENLMSEHKQAITKLEDEVVVLKNELHGLKQRMAKGGIEEKKKESEPERELSPCKEYKKTEDVREHQDDISRIFQEFATLAVRKLGGRLEQIGSEHEREGGLDLETGREGGGIELRGVQTVAGGTRGADGR